MWLSLVGLMKMNYQYRFLLVDDLENHLRFYLFVTEH